MCLTMETFSVEPVSRNSSVWRRSIRILAILAVAGLSYVAVRDLDLADLWLGIGALQVWQLGVLFFVDLGIHALMTARWWFIIRSRDRTVPYLPLIAIRLAAFGISYFTLGPQVGGEPIQVAYLLRYRRTTLPRAAASVLMDKLLELLANFALLGLALASIPNAQVLAALPGATLPVVAILLILAAWPLVHVVLLSKGRRPLSSLIRALPHAQRDSRLARHVRAAEGLAGQFCRKQRSALLAAISVSLLAATMSVVEYSLITSFIVHRLTLWQNVTAWSAGWLSFLSPTPAGLGALEASQVLTLGAFGVPAGLAIGVALIMRARDLVFGGGGLLIAAATATRLRSERQTRSVLVEKEP